MTHLLYFRVDPETSVAVEVDPAESGFEEAGLKRAHQWSAEQFGAAVGRGRRAAEETLQEFRTMAVPPVEVEIELGLKFVAEAGAVLAKTAAEGHLLVRLTWHSTAE